MEKEIFTLSELDAQPEADRPDTFTLSEIDAMETKEFNNSDIDLSQFLQIPESVYKGWETQGKMGYAEATNRKDLIEAVPFAGSATSAGALWKTNNAMQRISKNAYGEDKKQRNEDIMRVQRYALAIEERRVRGVSIMGQIAEGVTELPAFAGEFMLSGGIASAGAIATKQVAKKAIEAALKKAMSKKVANAVVGAVGGAAARTATTGVVRVAEGFEQRQVDARLEPTEKGIKLAQEIGEKPFTSFMKATGDVFIENLSEVSGAGFNFVGKGIIKSVVPKRMSDGLIRLYKKLHPNDDIGRLLTKTGYDGFLSEWLGEERLGSFLRAVAGVDDFGAKNPNSVFDRVVASVPSGEQLLVEAGVLSVPMLGSSAVRGAFRPKAADKLADTLLEEEQIDAIINDSPKTADDIAGISPKSQEGNTSQKVTADSAVSLRQLQVSRERFIEAGDTKAVALLDKLIEKNINQSPAEIPYVKDGKVHIYGIPEESTTTEAAIKFGAKYRGNEEMLNRIIDQKKINSQKLKDTFSVPVDKQDAAFDKMQEDLASTGHFLGEVIQEINGGLKNAEKPIMVPEFKESKDAIKYGSENKGQLPVLEKALEDVNNAIDKSSGGNEGFVLAKKATLLTESIRAAKGELTEEKAMAAIDKIKAQATKGVAKLSSAQQAIKDGLTEDQFVKAQQLTQTLRGTKGMTADQIQKQHPNIRLTKDIVAKDVYGNKVKIPDGEKLTPYEMKDGKIVLQDGQTYVVSKNQFANIKGNTVGGEAKPFAPELDGTEETVKGDDTWQKQESFMKEMEAKYGTGWKPKLNEVEANQLKTMSENDRVATTKYSQYQLPGGKNYKEILIKAPVVNSNNFNSSHWDEPNVIAHLRLNLRIFQGKLVTFMEELQSDWAREGRSKGFAQKVDKLPEGVTFVKGRDGTIEAYKDSRVLGTGFTFAQAKQNVLDKLSSGVPNNPLLKNWQVMSIKRALKEAVDNGSEYFAWINGEQTSARYNLATKVDNVEWLEPAKGKGKVISIRPLKSDGGAGSSIDINIDPTGKIIKSDLSDWKGKSLDEVLGKGLADKIMEKESGNLSGDGLKFGGEWADNLYDKQAGNIVKDLTGAEILVMDMGMSVSKRPEIFTTREAFGKFVETGDAALLETKPKFKVGEEIVRATEGKDDEFIITDILGDGKFRAVPKSGTTMDRAGKEALVNGEYSKVPKIYKETFDISTKTTTQQGIRLTPEIKARIRGEALDIQTSGRQFEDTTSQLRADYQAAKATTTSKTVSASDNDVPADGGGKTLPEKVVRIEEKGMPLSTFDKPHGIYTTPSEFKSPHEDLGGEKTTYNLNQNAKALIIKGGTDKSLAMRSGANSAGAGVYAARELLGNQKFEELKNLSKSDLVKYASINFKEINFNKYHDSQEVMEAIGAQLAKKNGYDLIYVSDKEMPEFSEVVLLNKNSITQAPNATPTREGFGEKNKVFTKESLDEAMKSLRSKMTGLHSGVDPTIIADLTKIGGYYFEGGLRDFSSWSKKLLSELGEKIRPYLKDVWDNINRDFSKTSSPVQDDIYTRNRLIKKGSPTRGGDVNFAEKLFTPISSRLKRINPSLKQALTKFEYDTANSIMSDTNAATPFLESVKKMSADDRADLDLAFKNGDVKKIDEVVKKYGISKQYKSIRSTLDSIHKKALEVGLDVGYIENYHPRIIKDVKGFLDHVRGGKHWSLISEAIQKKETELGRYLTDEEKAYAINTLLRGYSLGQIKLERPGNLKEREIDIITPEFNAFYEDSSSALVRYIEQVNENIAARRFFGKSEAFSNIDNSIGAYTARLLAEGKLTPNQELEVKQILQSRFNARGTSGPITIYKNLSYIDTMGSMVSAITQIGDLAFSLYRNGFLNTSSSFIEAVQGRSELTKRDLGIDKIAEEFKDTTRTGKWLKKVFNMTGLTWMDSLGKETLINSSIKNLRNLASKPTGEFEDRIEEVFGNESSQVIKDLKSGEITENVRLLAFSELSKFQPITLSEMPEKYLTGGNGRIFYMLKSYTIKQIDAVRNESFDLIAKGETAKGLGNLVRLSVALMAMNATADLIKDLLLNRPIEIEDLVIDNILRLLGFSKWQLYKARQEGVGTMLWQTITPPAKLVDSIIKDSSAIYNQKLESLPDLETIQSVPLVGKLFYWWFGKGSIKSDRKRGGDQKRVIK